jgi:flagellar M-ring protein FliF
MQHQGVFEQVADHIRREPVQSTRLLEAWIGATEDID